eukprot:CAMPEP_0185036146 /NCGR_PEP_ID=MMETSP1103-20130426/28668_1 /TAXON_ID=36769 /ORGANISM="Paraphysomonas bandaiensis, Strain Caron Lab Isolate" /LENGTH=460 /DNA_ID=CAMNT_0027573561 /DNA_START=1 /DNA_END=1383 /DNA_ORIENTATION=+
MQSTIDSSGLYAALRTLPKGSLLHSHDVSSQDMHFYINASYMKGCLYNTDTSSADYGALSFQPAPMYVPIELVRESWPTGVASFDEELYQNFTLLPYMDIPDTTGDFLWEKFQPIFSRVGMMYRYEPVFRMYYQRMFDQLYNDGVMRWEIRTSLDGLYDDTRSYSQPETMQIIIDTLREWQMEDYDSRGGFSFGIIMQAMRDGTVEEVVDALENAYYLRELFPDHIVGFDLVGHEDPGETLLHWAPVLIDAEEAIMLRHNYSHRLPFFFHAGESNRLAVQENLVDAVFLNSSRIGHGFGIQEFPALWPLLKQKGVLVESCPISNQVLGLVVDQRNHPIGQMLHHALTDFLRPDRRLPPAVQELLDYDNNIWHVFDNMVMSPSLAVSISNDDPGFWGIDAFVSYDWYIAVLAWDLSLSAIKQMAIDSIVHSAIPAKSRIDMLQRWSTEWDKWVSSLRELEV